MGNDKISFHPTGELQLSERLSRYMDDQGTDNRSEAVRAALHEGLASMGYEPSYKTAGDRWLGVVRGVGSVLGLTALILLGAGAFLPLFSQYGFGLAVASIGFFAGAEISDRHGRAILRYLKRKAVTEKEQWTASGD